MANEAHEALDRKLGIREVMRIEGRSRSTIYARIERGEFPAPIPNPDGRHPNQWWESTIREHQRAERARLDALAAERAKQRQESERAAA